MRRPNITQTVVFHGQIYVPGEKGVVDVNGNSVILPEDFPAEYIAGSVRTPSPAGTRSTPAGDSDDAETVQDDDTEEEDDEGSEDGEDEEENVIQVDYHTLTRPSLLALVQQRGLSDSVVATGAGGKATRQDLIRALEEG